MYSGHYLKLLYYKIFYNHSLRNRLLWDLRGHLLWTWKKSCNINWTTSRFVQITRAHIFSNETLGLHYCCSPLIILAVRIFLALGSDTAPIFEYLQHITKSLHNSSQKLKNNAINKFIARLFQTLWRENKGKSDQLYLQWIANYLMIACMCVAM